MIQINSLNDLVPRYYRNTDEINWLQVSMWYQPSLDFLEKFQSKLNWEKITMTYPITDEFLNIFKHKIHWDKITMNPNFNYDYILKYINNLTMTDLENYIRFNMTRLDKLDELRLIREMINRV